ncbi:YrbG protein [Bacillus freudenreichii]|nr:YrbG protein [Bacillus freudenreichii]
MNDFIVIILRTVVLYAIILVIFRLMGKREIGELSVLDLVIFIMIGEMAVIAIEQHKDPIMHTIVPMAVLLIIQVGMAYFSLRSRKFRSLIDGRSSVIIERGKINEKEMKRHRYNFDDLLMQLRLKDINNIADVEFAILETSGQLSVFKKENNKKAGSVTIPLIIDGEIQQDGLKESNKSEQWLRRELGTRGHKNIENISFCSFQDGKFFVDYIDEGKRPL